MALSKDVVIRLLGDATSAQKAIKAAADAAEVSVVQYRRAEREQARQAKAAELAARQQREAMESVGRGAMIMGAVVAAGLALSAKAAIDWESAWAGVEKTVDGTPEQMDELEASLRNLATTLPATHDEIAGVAEAAGQLGIAREDILEFTEVAIAMGVSTNLSADEAATAMARMSNIMGTSSKDVDRLGSTLVALGNAGASTEGEILDMGLRIAAAGRQAGMSEGDVLGLANAMSSLGIEAEAGGTAISTVIKSINSAVIDGGDQLEKYARVAGMSASQFAAAWRDDAAGALTMVVSGLGRMQAAGQNVNTVIDDLGLGGIRTSDTLLRLAGDVDGLRESLATGNRAWAENSALMNEANKRYETSAAQIQIARNQIADAAIDIGGFLLPVLAEGAELVADFARGFSELPGWAQDSVAVLGVLAATVGLVGGAAISAAPKIAAFRVTMATLAGASGTATSAVGRFGLFMTGPWGAAIGVATMALGGLITWLGSSSRASEQAASYQRDLASALRESGGAIDDNVRALAAQQAAEHEVGDSTLLEVADQLGMSLPKVTDALLGNRSAYEDLDAAAEAYLQRALELANYNTEDAGFVAASEKVGGFRDALGDLAPQMGEAVAENQRLADAAAASGDAAETTSSSMDSLAGATGDVAGNAEDAATAAEKLAEAMDALNGPTLDMREATRGYQDALDDARASLEEHGQKVNENTEAGRQLNDRLDSIATSAMEQANAIAANGGSYDAFRNSLEGSRQALIATAQDMGMTEAEAVALADSILQIPDAATVNISIPTYAQVTQQLIDVHSRVAGIPPQTWTNVGVISQPAITALEGVGYKTRTLPTGEVEVWADTAAAEAELQRLTRNRETVVRVRQVLSGIPLIGGAANGGPVPIGLASGGPVRGPGGPREDLVPAVGRNGTPYRLSDGEHILTAAEVIAAGGHAGVMEWRRSLLTGRGMAVGGGVGIPVGSRAANSWAPAIDYERMATALARAVGSRPLVSVGEWNSYDGTTPHENAEALGFLARTGSS